MKQKHIDVVVKYFYPVTAGIETNVLETYCVLAEQGWDITIHTSRDEYGKKDSLPVSETIYGLRVQRYSFGFFGFFPTIAWDTTDAVCLHNFDIFPHLHILLLALWKKHILRKPCAVFVTPHGGFNPEWSIFPRWQVLLKATYHFTLGTLLLNSVANGIRAVSVWEQKEMEKKGVLSSRIRVIENGIENEAFVDVDALASTDIQHRVASWGRYMVQIGRIHPIKNYEHVLLALPKLPSDVRFVIVGPVSDAAYAASLTALAETLHIADRVIFAGVVRGVDKFYLIRHAALMVHMALWESFCNAVHEGLSQGLVCVVANNTALPYLIQDGVNGYTVNEYDENAIAERINDVLRRSNTPELLQMKEENKKRDAQNTWRKVAERMATLYTEKGKEV